MFRKNFREGAKSSGGGGGGMKLTSKANRSQGKRSRDMGYGNMDADKHYRTHLFFSPNRGANSNDFEGLCIYFFLSLHVCVCVYFFFYHFFSLFLPCLSHHQSCHSFSQCSFNTFRSVHKFSVSSSMTSLSNLCVCKT